MVDLIVEADSIEYSFIGNALRKIVDVWVTADPLKTTNQLVSKIILAIHDKYQTSNIPQTINIRGIFIEIYYYWDFNSINSEKLRPNLH